MLFHFFPLKKLDLTLPVEVLAFLRNNFALTYSVAVVEGSNYKLYLLFKLHSVGESTSL